MFLCFNGDTGAVIWQRQMTEEFGMISTFGGRTPSPAIDEDQVFLAGVSFGWGNYAGGQHRIFAFNKNTGELNWSAGTGGIPVDAPYNTPVISVVNGQKLVMFAAGDGGVHAFQARTGKKVWSFKGSKHGMNSSVVIQGDHIFASWDLDNFDSTKLGRVVCLDGANVVNGSPKEIWRQDGIEAGFPSPTLYDGTLYVPTDNAVLYCARRRYRRNQIQARIRHDRQGFPRLCGRETLFPRGQRPDVDPPARRQEIRNPQPRRSGR